MAISVARDLTLYLYINAKPLSFAAAVFGWQKTLQHVSIYISFIKSHRLVVRAVLCTPATQTTYLAYPCN
jgi:hypothetical protein